MKKSFLKKLCCPMDKHELNIQIFTETEEDEVLEALMCCPLCNRYFPVIYGIPVLIPDEYRNKTLEAPQLKKWGSNLKGGSQPLINLQKNQA